MRVKFKFKIHGNRYSIGYVVRINADGTAALSQVPGGVVTQYILFSRCIPA